MSTSQALLEVEPQQIGAAVTQDWTNLGGAFRGIPSSIYYGGTLFAFTRNMDNTLGMCQVQDDSSGAWSSFGNIALAASPGVAPSPNGTIGVVGLTMDNQVKVTYVDPFQGVATLPEVIAGGTPAGFTFVGSPILAVNINQRIEAFILDSTGMMWHTYQSGISTPIQWSTWSPLGAPAGGFKADVPFTVFLVAGSSGALQAVGIGSDNSMYQMTQYASGGNDGWSAPQAVAPDSHFRFTNGAADYCAATGKPVYVGLNANPTDNNMLLFCAPNSAFPNWGAVNLSPAQQPRPALTPLIVDNFGTPQLAWLAATSPGQIEFASQSRTSSNFWAPAKPLGSPNARLFTGQMSGVANNGNVALFQLCTDTTLAFINYSS